MENRIQRHGGIANNHHILVQRVKRGKPAIILKSFSVLACGVLAICFGGCTGGQRTEAGEISPIRATTPTATSVAKAVTQPSPSQALHSIHPGIPVYAGAQFRPDLTLHDEVEIRRQFGQPAEVYTLTSTDSFPKVWHYYVTYLAQYRAFRPPRPFPPENQSWRTMQVNLNAAMKDPFIPGDGAGLQKNVLLQISESESASGTVIRYIVTNDQVTTPQVVVQ